MNAPTEAKGRLPDFLLIGAAKSGTTTLYNWLNSHPQIHMPARKELRFFDWHWTLGTEWYASQFSGADDAIAVGEATPYMSQETAAERIASVVPGAKLLAVLRNPIDRAYSHYQFRVGWRVEKRTFAEALAAERRGESDKDAQYVGDGRYLQQLLRFTDRFPREQLDVLLLEDLKGDPSGSFQDTCSFIGVAPGEVPDNIGTRYNSAYRLRSYRAWYLQRKYQDRLHIPRRVRSFLHDTLNKVPVSYEPLDPDMRAELARDFAEDNAALADWLGRDLTAWSR